MRKARIWPPEKSVCLGDPQDFVDRGDPRDHFVPPVGPQGFHPTADGRLLDYIRGYPLGGQLPNRFIAGQQLVDSLSPTKTSAPAVLASHGPIEPKIRVEPIIDRKVIGQFVDLGFVSLLAVV